MRFKLFAELDTDGAQVIAHLVRVLGPDQGAGHRGKAQQPGDRHLDHGDPLFIGDPPEFLHDVEVVRKPSALEARSHERTGAGLAGALVIFGTGGPGGSARSATPWQGRLCARMPIPSRSQ